MWVTIGWWIRIDWRADKYNDHDIWRPDHIVSRWILQAISLAVLLCKSLTSIHMFSRRNLSRQWLVARWFPNAGEAWYHGNTLILIFSQENGSNNLATLKDVVTKTHLWVINLMNYQEGIQFMVALLNGPSWSVSPRHNFNLIRVIKACFSQISSKKDQVVVRSISKDQIEEIMFV